MLSAHNDSFCGDIDFIFFCHTDPQFQLSIFVLASFAVSGYIWMLYSLVTLFLNRPLNGICTLISLKQNKIELERGHDMCVRTFIFKCQV